MNIEIVTIYKGSKDFSSCLILVPESFDLTEYMNHTIETTKREVIEPDKERFEKEEATFIFRFTEKTDLEYSGYDEYEDEEPPDELTNQDPFRN